MKKIELLSPVGDFECLKAAVQNGADSVYLGFEVENKFVVGFGLDYDGLYRNIDEIGVLKKEIYMK